MADDDAPDWGVDPERVEELQARAAAALAGDDEPGEPAPAADRLACPTCGDMTTSAGKPFTPLTLGAHRAREHGYRKDDAGAPSGKATTKTASKARAVSSPRRSSSPSRRAPSRKDTYQAGIATMATGLRMLRAFDDWDYGHVINCAPLVADAAAAFAETNDSFRRGADMILGGPINHPGAAFVLATLGMLAPILAHKGFIPESMGLAFMPFAGRSTTPPPAVPMPPVGDEPAAAPRTYATAAEAEAELQRVMFEVMNGCPPNVQADLAARMMGGVPPTETVGI